MTKANELFPNNDQPRPSDRRPSRYIRDILVSISAILFFSCLLLTRLRGDWHMNWWICALPAVLSVAFALWALTYNGKYKNDANRRNKAIHTAMARAGIDIQQTIYLEQQPSLYMRECKQNLHRILFESGADINDRDLEWGRTPLMWASERCTNPEVIDALLAAGANVHLRDRFRRTALHCAMFNTNSAIAQALLRGGARVNVRDRNGFTPLMFAAWFGYSTETVKLLLIAGARTDTKSKAGKTALELVKLADHVTTRNEILQSLEMTPPRSRR